MLPHLLFAIFWRRRSVTCPDTLRSRRWCTGAAAKRQESWSRFLVCSPTNGDCLSSNFCDEFWSPETNVFYFFQQIKCVCVLYSTIPTRTKQREPLKCWPHFLSCYESLVNPLCICIILRCLEELGVNFWGVQLKQAVGRFPPPKKQQKWLKGLETESLRETNLLILLCVVIPGKRMLTRMSGLITNSPICVEWIIFALWW